MDRYMDMDKDRYIYYTNIYYLSPKDFTLLFWFFSGQNVSWCDTCWNFTFQFKNAIKLTNVVVKVN